MFKIICLIAILIAFSEGSPLLSGNFESRIVGGQGAYIENHRYQVSLRTAGNFHFCGASIISNRWVLTAAHCTIDNADDSIFVWVGATFLNTGGVRLQSMRIINHPDYVPASLQNDVALIQTSQTIPINNINTAIIPMARHFTEANRDVIVTGWGYLETGANTPNQLQKLTTKTMTNEECLRTMHESFVPESKLCTNVGAGRGICQGDSGGPLNENGWLVGIVSWNIPCALGYPDGFERVAYFRGWITQQSGVN